MDVREFGGLKPGVRTSSEYFLARLLPICYSLTRTRIGSDVKMMRAALALLFCSFAMAVSAADAKWYYDLSEAKAAAKKARSPKKPAKR